MYIYEILMKSKRKNSFYLYFWCIVLMLIGELMLWNQPFKTFSPICSCANGTMPYMNFSCGRQHNSKNEFYEYISPVSILWSCAAASRGLSTRVPNERFANRSSSWIKMLYQHATHYYVRIVCLHHNIFI